MACLGSKAQSPRHGGPGHGPQLQPRPKPGPSHDRPRPRPVRPSGPAPPPSSSPSHRFSGGCEGGYRVHHQMLNYCAWQEHDDEKKKANMRKGRLCECAAEYVKFCAKCGSELQVGNCSRCSRGTPTERISSCILCGCRTFGKIFCNEAECNAIVSKLRCGICGSGTGGHKKCVQCGTLTPIFLFHEGHVCQTEGDKRCCLYAWQSATGVTVPRAIMETVARRSEAAHRANKQHKQADIQGGEKDSGQFALPPVKEAFERNIKKWEENAARRGKRKRKRTKNEQILAEYRFLSTKESGGEHYRRVKSARIGVFPVEFAYDEEDPNDPKKTVTHSHEITVNKTRNTLHDSGMPHASVYSRDDFLELLPLGPQSIASVNRVVKVRRSEC